PPISGILFRVPMDRATVATHDGVLPHESKAPASANSVARGHPPNPERGSSTTSCFGSSSTLKFRSHNDYVIAFRSCVWPSTASLPRHGNRLSPPSPKLLLATFGPPTLSHRGRRPPWPCSSLTPKQLSYRRSSGR